MVLVLIRTTRTILVVLIKGRRVNCLSQTVPGIRDPGSDAFLWVCFWSCFKTRDLEHGPHVNALPQMPLE